MLKRWLQNRKFRAAQSSQKFNMIISFFFISWALWANCMWLYYYQWACDSLQPSIDKYMFQTVYWCFHNSSFTCSRMIGLLLSLLVKNASFPPQEPLLNLTLKLKSLYTTTKVWTSLETFPDWLSKTKSSWYFRWKCDFRDRLLWDKRCVWGQGAWELTGQQRQYFLFLNTRTGFIHVSVQLFTAGLQYRGPVTALLDLFHFS